MKHLLTLAFSLMLMGAKSQFKYGDLVIHELMADPSPVVGLPNAEYVELRNTSGKPINLNKWKLGNGGTYATIPVNHILEPDSLVVVCSKTNAASFPYPFKTIGISSFPSLANETDLISLHDPDGNTIHAIRYKSSWHANTLKQEGGWSLEMKDAKQPCHPNNWSSSIDRNGGTPGKANSITATLPPSAPITAIECIATGPSTLRLELSAPADSTSGAMHTQFRLENETVSIIKSIPQPPLFQSIAINLSDTLATGKTYLLQANQIQGCNGEGSHSFEVRTGRAKSAISGDVLLNEILFNPPPGGSDFIELVNTSNAIINAKEIHLAGVLPNGQAGLALPITTEDRNLFPDEPFVICTDSQFIRSTWPSCIPERIIQSKTLPSLPDDAGAVFVMNREGETLDKMIYNDDMHFPLLRNKEGVSLERLSNRSTGTNPQNWHSAAASAGYATPTLQNSQATMSDQNNGDVSFSPTIVSPDNDGTEDVLNIDYNFSENGVMMSVMIFTSTGMPVAKPVDNQLCGLNGSFHWNGLDAKGRRLPVGTYIVMAEYGTLQGVRKKKKRLLGIR